MDLGVRPLSIQAGRLGLILHSKKLTPRSVWLASIERGLMLRFGADGLRIWPEIRPIEDLDLLRVVQAGLLTAQSVDELRRIYLA
jgi:hypothetical protein